MLSAIGRVNGKPLSLWMHNRGFLNAEHRLRVMLRRTLTIVSLIGLVISVGLWGVSFTPGVVKVSHPARIVPHQKLNND